MATGTGPSADAPALVGSSRHALASGLFTTWEHVQASSRRVWLTLEGEPGIGKTRVVHEFYGQLARTQEPPQYWPQDVHGNDQLAGPRKAAGPLSWQRPPGALPSFLWLGFSGRRGDGLPEAQLAAELRQLDEHYPLVQRAAGRLNRTRGHLDHLGDEVRGMTVEEAATRAVEGGLKLIGAQVPGVSQLLSLTDTAVSRYRDERALTHRLRAGEDMALRSVAGGAVDQFVQRINFAATFMGVVLFVEDLHQCHPLLVDALKRLLAEDTGRLLVMTTEWELGRDRLAEAAGERYVAVRESGVVSPSPELAGCFSSEASLAPLDISERLALVREQVPNATSLSAEALAEQYENVQMLTLVCSLKRTRDALESRTLDPKVVQDLPRKVEQFLDESWSDLAATTRALLMEAACLAPASIEESAHGANLHFDERIDVAMFQTPPDPVDLDRATRLHWLEVGSRSRSFVDKQRRRLALREADDEALTDHRWADLAKRTDDPDWALPLGITSSVEQAIRDGVTVALSRAGYVVNAARLLESCYRLVVDLRNALGDIPIVSEISETAVRAADAAGLREDPLAVLLSEAWARALAERGEPRRAMEVLHPLVTSHDVRVSESHRLRLEWLYARAVRSVGRSADALARFEQIAGQQAALGGDLGDLLRTRCDIAFTHAVKGEYGLAQWILQAILDSSWPAEARHDLARAEHQMASVLRRRGNLARAYDVASSLHDRQRQDLGRTHPDTLATQQLVVATLRDRGRLSEAMSQALELVELRTRVLGPSQSTREAESHVAWLQRKLGNFEQAAADFHRLTTQSEGVDTHHWTTLRDLHNYAVCRRDAGHFDEAIDLLADVQARSDERDAARIAVVETIRERGRSHLFRFVRTGAVADLSVGTQLLLDAQARAEMAEDVSQPMWWQLHIDAVCATAISGGWTVDRLQQLAGLCRSQVADLGSAHPEVLRSSLYLAEAHAARGRDELARLMVEDVANRRESLGIDPRHPLVRLIERGRAGETVMFV